MASIFYTLCLISIKTHKIETHFNDWIKYFFISLFLVHLRIVCTNQINRMTSGSFSWKRNTKDFTVEFVFTICQIRVSVNSLKAINGSALMAGGNTPQLQSGCSSICDPPVSPPENTQTSLRRERRLYFRPSEDTSLKRFLCVWRSDADALTSLQFLKEKIMFTDAQHGVDTLLPTNFSYC